MECLRIQSLLFFFIIYQRIEVVIFNMPLRSSRMMIRNLVNNAVGKQNFRIIKKNSQFKLRMDTKELAERVVQKLNGKIAPGVYFQLIL